MYGLLVRDELRGPHLVLADAGDVDRVRAGDLAESLDHVLRSQAAVGRRLVAERVRARQSSSWRHHSARSGLGPLCQRDDQLADHLPAVADDRHVRDAVLADLGRVDVGVDDLRVGREGRQLAGDPVVEPGAERDQQVGLLQRGDRGDRAVHAGHAQVLVVAVRERAARHQRGDHRDAGELGELRAAPAAACAFSTPPPT